jgi:GT2 family glycosyltransferase
LATGDYIVLLDHDDELAPHALYENAKLINQHPEADYIYSDRDLIDINQKHFRIAFKPDWSPEHFYACMYTFHLGVFRTTLIRELGGFCSEYDGAQDYDLALRVVERTKNIFHIHKVLYHWRTLPTSLSSGPVKEYAFMASVNAVQASLDRRGIKAKVKLYNDILGWDYHQVDYEVIDNPLVSIIVIDSGEFLQGKQISTLTNCLQSVIEKTNYKSWEMTIVDSNNASQTTLDKIIMPNSFKLLDCDEKLNFSQRVNLAASHARGEYLLLLDDDTEPINSEWLESLLQLAQLKGVGAVGAKLIFPDHTLHHVGIVIPDVQRFYYGYPYHGYSDSFSGYCNFCKIVRNYIAVTRTCLMVRRKSFEEVGGLNEDLPHNYNDIDFCLKLHRAGYHNVYTPYAKLYHHESPLKKPIEPWEVQYMQTYWSDYMESLGGYDPYYNLNFSPYSANFEL